MLYQKNPSYFILSIVACLLCCSLAHAQNQTTAGDTGKAAWQLQYPAADFSSPLKMYAANQTTLYILSKGFILRSSDAGVTWQMRQLPGGFTVYGASFWGNSLCWLAGDGGVIYKSTDGGITWALHTIPFFTVDMRTVQFLSPTLGWASGTEGLVYETTDGGDTWTVQNYLQFFKTSTQSYVKAITDSIIWVVQVEIDASFPPQNGGIVTVYRTTNAGTTWNQVRNGPIFETWSMADLSDFLNGSATDMSGAVDFSLTNVCSDSSAEFQIILHGLYSNSNDYRTTNAGSTWDSSTIDPSSLKDYIRMFNGSQGWCTNFRSYYKVITVVQTIDTVAIKTLDTLTTLYRSTGTDTAVWAQRNTPATAHISPHLYDFLDTTTGWCFTMNDNNTISIFETQDGAQTWQLKSTYPLNSGSLRSVFFLDSLNGWCAGKNAATGGIVVHTSNQGETWSVLNSSIYDSLKQIQFVDKMDGWALGDSLYETNDGGMTWRANTNFPLDTVRPNVNYIQIQFTDKNTGWLVRSDWMTYRTTNGGSSWAIAHGSDTTVNLTYALATSDTTLIAFGTISDSAYEFRILGGGASFGDNPISNGIGGAGNSPTTPAAVCFYNVNRGWLIDTAGNEYLTSDGGNSWGFVVSTNSWLPTLALDFPDTTSGWLLKGNSLAGSSALFNLTQNGLNVTATPDILHQLNAITFVGDSLGWAVGENLAIYHYYLSYTEKNINYPQMVLSPPVLDFDSVAPQKTKQLTVQISNPGGDTLIIYNAVLASKNDIAFNIATLVSPEAELFIPPGQSLPLYVSFSPPYLGREYYDTLYLYSNADTQYIFVLGFGDIPNAIIAGENPLPMGLSLDAYPNPFTGNTTIAYSVPEGSQPVALKVYDIHGSVIADLSSHLTGNNGSILFSAEGLPEGDYFFDLIEENRQILRRIVRIH